jgi:predicted RNase H-like HicB family nuclease
MDPDKYTYQIFWSPDDNEYVGICLEFKYLSWLADTPDKTFQGIRNIVKEVLELMIEDGDPIPSPMKHPTLEP